MITTTSTDHDQRDALKRNQVKNIKLASVQALELNGKKMDGRLTLYTRECELVNNSSAQESAQILCRSLNDGT